MGGFTLQHKVLHVAIDASKRTRPRIYYVFSIFVVWARFMLACHWLFAHVPSQVPSKAGPETFEGSKKPSPRFGSVPQNLNMGPISPSGRTARAWLRGQATCSRSPTQVEAPAFEFWLECRAWRLWPKQACHAGQPTRPEPSLVTEPKPPLTSDVIVAEHYNMCHGAVIDVQSP